MSDTDSGARPSLTALLDVQDHDTRLDQLRHRRDTLVERASVTAIEQAIASLAAQRDQVGGILDELGRAQRRLEDEVAAVEAKAGEVHGTLYGGTVTSPRELQDLQADLESLQRRQRELEDRVIELMEQQEEPRAEQARLDAELATRHDELDAARRALTVAEAEVEAELQAVADEREALAAGIPAGLLEEYGRLRAGLGGIGAARLEAGGRCGGCQLQLSAVERDRIKSLPADALVHCEECGRLLVR